MADELLTELDEAFGELFDLLAGDPLTAVAEDGTQYELQTIRWEPDSDTATQFEGLAIDAAGMRDQQERNVMLLKSDLEANGLSDIDPTMHFLIDGVRWDLVKGKPIRRDLAPIKGWQGLIMITIRKAVELASSTPGTDFTIAE